MSPHGKENKQLICKGCSRWVKKVTFHIETGQVDVSLEYCESEELLCAGCSPHYPNTTNEDMVNTFSIHQPNISNEELKIIGKYDLVESEWCEACKAVTYHVADLGKTPRCKMCEDRK